MRKTVIVEPRHMQDRFFCNNSQLFAAVNYYHRELHLKYDKAPGFASTVDGAP